MHRYLEAAFNAVSFCRECARSLTRRRNWDMILEITENIIVLLFSKQGGVPIERPNC